MAALVLFLMPESLRFLASQGRRDDARLVARKLDPSVQLDPDLKTPEIAAAWDAAKKGPATPVAPTPAAPAARQEDEPDEAPQGRPGLAWGKQNAASPGE